MCDRCLHYSICSKSNAICSGDGSSSISSFGSFFTIWYEETLIGLVASFRAYSTTVLFLLLQRMIPMDGFSPSIRTVSSRTDEFELHLSNVFRNELGNLKLHGDKRLYAPAIKEQVNKKLLPFKPLYDIETLRKPKIPPLHEEISQCFVLWLFQVLLRVCLSTSKKSSEYSSFTTRAASGIRLVGRVFSKLD